MNGMLKERTVEFELRKPFGALVAAANRENGWGGRIRTYVWRIQSPLPYHLATPQWLPVRPQYRVAPNPHPSLPPQAGRGLPTEERAGASGPFMNALDRVNAALCWRCCSTGREPVDRRSS